MLQIGDNRYIHEEKSSPPFFYILLYVPTRVKPYFLRNKQVEIIHSPENHFFLTRPQRGLIISAAVLTTGVCGVNHGCSGK